jgi:hypothetical protein
MVDIATHTPNGKEVEVVTADEWMNMSINDLFDQKLVLNNRLNIASQYGNPAMLKQIQAGIMQLEAIIRHKEQQHIKNINNRNRDVTGLI